MPSLFEESVERTNGRMSSFVQYQDTTNHPSMPTDVDTAEGLPAGALSIKK